MPRTVLSILIRLAVTVFAFWWIFRLVDVEHLLQTMSQANPWWLLIGVFLFGLTMASGIYRWYLLIPHHPAIRLPFLGNSYFVATFFSTFLPTTIGGDVIRGYDLIKATGQWRESLASVLIDRLVGFSAMLLMALGAWFLLPDARQDPVIRTSFFGFCALVVVAFAVLGSRRILHTMLKPFGKIGLGQLQSHAKQFQESLLTYQKTPQKLLVALGISLVMQGLVIGMSWAVVRALNLNVPILFLILFVPMVNTISQIPISLNGWGIREMVTIQLLGRVGVSQAQALALSLICASIPLVGGVVGAILFLTRKKRKRS